MSNAKYAYQRLHREELQEIADLYEAGWGTREIADEVMRPTTLVQAYIQAELRHCRAKVYPRHMSEEAVQRALSDTRQIASIPRHTDPRAAEIGSYRLLKALHAYFEKRDASQ